MAEKSETPLLGAYLVTGDDTLKKQRVTERLRTRLEALGDVAFNSDAFDGESASGVDIVAACNTLPFASDKRFVSVSHADKMRKADSEALVAYLASPSPSTVLLLEAEKLAKSTRLYKAVAALGPSAVIDCSLPKAYELPRQVEAMARRYGLALDRGACEALVAQVGTDTVRIDGELARLGLERGQGALTASDILSSVARTASAKPWELADAFAGRDIPRCLALLKRLDDSSPYALISICCTRIRELMCAQSVSRRRDGSTLASELKLPDWRLRNHGRWAQGFTPEELACALRSARDAEEAMKTGSDADAAFQDWMVSVLRR